MREVKDTAKAVRRAFDPKLTSDPHILSKAIATWWLHEEPAPPPVLPLVHAPGARRASDTQSSPARAATPLAVMTATTSGVEVTLVSFRSRPRCRPLALAPPMVGARRPLLSGALYGRRAAGVCSSRRRRSRQAEPPARRDVSGKQDAAPSRASPAKAGYAAARAFKRAHARGSARVSGPGPPVPEALPRECARLALHPRNRGSPVRGSPSGSASDRPHHPAFLLPHPARSRPAAALLGAGVLVRPLAAP